MRFLGEWLVKRALRREPDFLVGGRENPYMRRWWIIPRNAFFNIYLHQFLRDDEDRALHDHPWWSLSYMVRGSLLEYQELRLPRWISAGAWTWRSSRFAHRLVVPVEKRGHTWTIFITGPRVREWGFHCPNGWVHWEKFVAADDKGAVGKGCGG